MVESLGEPVVYLASLVGCIPTPHETSFPRYKHVRRELRLRPARIDPMAVSQTTPPSGYE